MREEKKEATENGVRTAMNYQERYSQTLRIIITGGIWNVLFSLIALIMGFVMMLNGVKGAWVIVVPMVLNLFVMITITVKAGLKSREEERGLLDG